MTNKGRLYSVALALIAMVLFLILISSVGSAQSQSNAEPTSIHSASVTARYVYIVNWGSNTVSVIDTATNTVTATVNVGNGPSGVANQASINQQTYTIP
jgi:YVTN family beta-propeller protein